MIKRTLFPALVDHLEAPEITLLIGPRQAGKTTLLRWLREVIESNGKEPVLFFNLDIATDEYHFRSQSALLQRIQLEAGPDRPAFLIIDEIQRLPDAGRFLKGIYDQQLPYKMIISGSGSLELKEKISESLVGRKRVFSLLTVSPREFLDHRTDYRYSSNLSQWAALEPEKADQLLLEYLNFGGYPRVVTAPTIKEKQLVLQEILESYLLRDIKALLNIDRTEAFSLMLRLLATRIGQLTTNSNLARETTIALPTLKKYLWYAEQTFILERIPPFFNNPGKELVKSPHYYFTDLGFRNFLLDLAGRIMRPSESGFLFQNFVWRLLHPLFADAFEPIHHWRTKDKAEVDFVIKTGNQLLPVEVKAGKMKTPLISRSFRNFCTTYHPPEAWVINRTLSTSLQLDKTKVYFRPWHELLE